MKPIDHYWNGWHPLTFLLLPLSGLFCLVVLLRRMLYRWGVLRSDQLSVPVIVIGNLSVGGTGKTPLTVWLARWLRGQGLKPGIITRGYGGQAGSWPQKVEPDTPAGLVGDEAVLMRRRAACPVYAGPGRLQSARALLAEEECDIILSDDGLQHYAMKRDMELTVIDGERRFGNGLCLPAGPLREPASRLNSVDLVLVNGEARQGEVGMRVGGDRLLSVNGSRPPAWLADLRGRVVEAVAGIGNPERFFRMLEAAGLIVNRHPFPDHHPFSAEDMALFSGRTVIMTEKDAVKCVSLAADDVWYVPVDAYPDQNFVQQLERLIDRMING